MAGHWPQFGGDPGKSGHQPVLPAGLPVQPKWAKLEEGTQIRTSPLITLGDTAAGKRVIYGTDNGSIHTQRLTTGGSVGAESGIALDDGPVNDTDSFGDGLENVTPVETSTNPSGNILVLYNEDNQTGGTTTDARTGSDIALASIRTFQLANGGQTVVKGFDTTLGPDACTNTGTANCIDIPNTIDFTLNSSPVLGPVNESGERQLFFSARRTNKPNAANNGNNNPCQSSPSDNDPFALYAGAGNFENPPEGSEQTRDCRVPPSTRLFSVTLSEDPESGDVSLKAESLRMSKNLSVNTFAPPALAYLRVPNPEDNTQSVNKLHLLYATNAGAVAAVPADNLRPGCEAAGDTTCTPLTSPVLGDLAWGPSVPTTADGGMPQPAPYVYSAVEQLDDNVDPDDPSGCCLNAEPDDFRVVKLGPTEDGTNPIGVIQVASGFVRGNPGNSLANSRIVGANGTGGQAGRVVVTSNDISRSDTGEVGNGGVFSFDSETLGAQAAFTAGKPFHAAVPALSGNLAFVMANDGDQFVLDQRTLEEVPASASGFSENPANLHGDADTNGSAAFGQPAISSRWVVFTSDDGSFGYTASTSDVPGETAPAYAINDNSIRETDTGESALTFTVTRFGPKTFSSRVRVSTSDGSAVAGQDYRAVNQLVTFPAGESERTISVPILNENVAENDETFFVNLSEATPSDAAILDAQGIGLIVSDDASGGGTPLIGISDVIATEGTNAVFTIGLTQAARETVLVDFATAEDTAKSGADYGGGAGTLTFTPGQTVKTITVPIVNDGAAEKVEQFFVNLSNVRGPAALVKPRGTGIIQEADRVAARGFSARTTPRKDTTRPFKFTTRGRLTLPSGMSRSAGCAGRVTVQIKAVPRKTLSTRRVRLSRSCTFRSVVSFRKRSRFPKSGLLEVQARFLGNGAVLPRKAKTHRVDTN